MSFDQQTLDAPAKASRRGRAGSVFARGAAIVAGTAVLVLGGVSVANAAGTVGTWDEGHVDFIHTGLSADGSQFVLGANVDETETYYPGSAVDASAGTPEWDVTVNETDGAWIIPAVQETGVVYAGFAGAGEDLDGSYSLFNELGLNDTVTLSLEVVSAPAGGDVEITWPSGRDTAAVPGFTGDGSSEYDITFALQNDEEAFHQHPQIEFTEAGTYQVEVVASTATGDVADSDPIVYQFVTN